MLTFGSYFSLWIFHTNSISSSDQKKGSLYVVVANVLHCDIIVDVFELQLHDYVRFRTNTLAKVIETHITPSYGFSIITTALLLRTENFAILFFTVLGIVPSALTITVLTVTFIFHNFF